MVLVIVAGKPFGRETFEEPSLGRINLRSPLLDILGFLRFFPGQYWSRGSEMSL